MRSMRRLMPKRLAPSRVLMLFLAAIALVTLLTFRTSPEDQDLLLLSEGRGESSAMFMRHRSLVTAAERGPHLPRGTGQHHSFLILENHAGGTLHELQPFLVPYRQYPDAVRISHLTGAAAYSLAAQFLVQPDDLPGVLYLPPAYETGGSFQLSSFFSIHKNAGGVHAFPAWAKLSSRMQVLLLNDWDEASVCFYHLNADGVTQIEVGCPATQVETWKEASLLDVFIARNSSGGPEIARHVVLFSGVFSVHEPGFCNYLVDSTCELAKLPFPTDQGILSIRLANTEKRLQAIKDQPSQFRHYTKVGFEKRKAPPEVYQALTGYLNASWDNIVRELWNPQDVFTNHFYAPSLKVPLPEIGPLKPRLFKEIRGILETWINNVPLTPTALYGLRIYSRNNTLLMHCDRPDTHIVSAIINVRQDVEEPWPLHIMDHSGTRHRVIMEPGDMVMYEGATCAHGREDHLKGRYFANVFVHFRPTGQQ